MHNPLTGSDNAILEKEFSAQEIVSAYKDQLSMDVSRFFKSGKSDSTKPASLYRCPDTGYRFFSPIGLAGDDVFYQELEKQPWYYMGWKWEHETAARMIKKGESVLEIGCAEGSFLEGAAKKGASVEGLEMNSKAVEICRSKGLSAHTDPIESFAVKNKGRYDLVCSFQVLEHIADPKPFIEASLEALKPGGRLLICVPNNDSVVFAEDGGALNMPPHHMGRWNPDSLLKLQDHFNMKVQSIRLEPLQSYHFGFATRIADKAILGKLRKKLGIFSSILFPLFSRAARMISYTAVSVLARYIHGHSVLIVFTKNHEA